MLGTVLVAFAVVVGLIVRGFLSGPDHTAVEGDEVTFSVEPGKDLGSVAARLDRAGIVGSARAFERAARDTGSGLVRSGDFVLRERMPAAEALAVLQGATDGAMTTAFPRALLPAIGAVVLGGGEAAVGVLLAAMAAGAFLAGLFSAPFTRLHAQGWGVYVSILVWGGAVAAFGGVVWWAQSLPDGDPRLTLAFALAALCMAVGGAADSLSGVFRGSILQSATPDHLRGRLQGVFVVVVAGGPRLGELLTGGASVGLGEGPTLLAGGVLCMLGVTALMRWEPGFLRYDARNPTP